MSCKNLVLIIISLFVLFPTVPIKSQEVDSLYYIDPNAFVAREIFKNKIVMLGDGGHHQPAVYHYVFGTLYKWLDMCKNKPGEEHLTLIVEYDKPLTDLLSEYMKDGDMQALVKNVNSEFYLEDLEYYTNLRKFSITIDSLNQHREKKIYFKVKGFEEAGEIVSDRMYRMSQREHEMWFVNERDSVSAEGIINYINTNLDEKILIFYGGAHLINRKYNKIPMVRLKTLTPEEGEGFFLAYFLDKEYGADNVLKIMPWNSVPFNPKQDFPYPVNQSFIAKREDLGIPDSLEPRRGFIYNYQYDYLPMIDGERICSKLILDKTIELLKHIESLLPGYIAQRYYYYNMINVSFLTGRYFKNDSALNQWVGKNNFDETNWLYSNEFNDTLLNWYIKSGPNPDFFRSYGIRWVYDTSKAHLEKIKKYIFPELIRQLRITNSIGIYWFGYSDEKVKAKEYLVKFSGQDYSEPEKYLQWYRMKYYGYKY